MDDKLKIIIEKVTSMYLDYGIKGVTMDDVANKLAISKKTLYQYFKDKKELVMAVLEHQDTNRNIDFSILEKQDTNAIDELFYYYEIQVQMIKNHKPAFVHDLRKYYPEIFTHFQKIKHKRIFESIKGNLIKGKKEGLYRKELNEDVLSRLNLMRIEAIMNTDFFSVEELVSTDLFSEIFRYNLFGIVSETGRK